MRPYEVLLPIPRPVDPIVADYHPAEAALAANYPNPTSGSTTIPFFLPADDNIRVDIVDINGRPVKELASGLYPAGNHQLEWNGTNSAGSLVPSGIYIYQLHTSNEVFSQQMIIQR